MPNFMTGHPMCLWDEDEVDPLDRRTEYEDDTTGGKEKITRFADGSSIRHCGGPAGPMYYDKYGEEC